MKLTRREILKLAAAAAGGMLLPGAEAQLQGQERLDRALAQVLNRLATDREYRYQMVKDPYNATARTRLTTEQQARVIQRLTLVSLLAHVLARQVMKDSKSLRPVLLDHDKSQAALFGGPRQADAIFSGERIDVRDRARVDKIRQMIDALGRDIFTRIPRDIRFLMEHYPRIPVPGKAGTDNACSNVSAEKCKDSSNCIDNMCTNYTECSDDTCADCSCVNAACDDSNCADDEGFDATDCFDVHPCWDIVAPLGIDEAFMERLDGMLQEALDRGPELDFFVRLGDQTIDAETLLDPEKLHQALPD